MPLDPLAVELILGEYGAYTPPPGDEVPLAFGPPPGSSGSIVEVIALGRLLLRGTGALPLGFVVGASGRLRLRGTASIEPPVLVQAPGRLRLRAAVAVGHDPAVPVLLRAAAQAPWGLAGGREHDHAAAWAAAGARQPLAGVAWAYGASSAATVDARWRSGAAAQALQRLPWAQSALRQASTEARWQQAGAAGREVEAAWRNARLAHDAIVARWQRAGQANKTRRSPWQAGAALPHAVRVVWDGGALVRAAMRAPWQGAGRLRSSGSAFVPGSVVPPVLPLVPTDLHFCAAFDVSNALALRLLLGIDPCVGFFPDAPSYILPRSVYMSVHTIAAVRLPELTPLDLFSADLSSDEGSFGWSLTAAGPASLLELLAPSAGAPAQLRITLDDIDFVFAVEGLRRTREFGRSGATISGRSLTALVGAPYMLDSNWYAGSPATAQQLAESALEFSGVALDWQITDWLVPGGAWSYAGTPLAAVLRVAEAAGAVVQSHRSAPTLRVIPRYPLLPWQWAAATPDVQIPLDAVVRDGWERADRPAYNGVYVSGQSQGVLAHVKRTGSAGELQPPMVTDALLTHADAARQRGGSILGAAGAQARVTLDLPVLSGLSEPGVIDVGKLIQVVEPGDVWRGLVRGVSVNAKRPSLRQTLTVERHL